MSQNSGIGVEGNHRRFAVYKPIDTESDYRKLPVGEFQDAERILSCLVPQEMIKPIFLSKVNC
jgi:hypothetical protein